MRILFVSASPLKKEISIGNTFISLFEGAKDVELASICTREGSPDPKISRCFCITEKMLISNLLRKTPVGTTMKAQDKTQKPLQNPTEKMAFRLVKRSRLTVFFWMQDLVWILGNWKSSELKSFVQEYNPDIIFTVLSNSVFLNNLILHIHSLSNAKLVIYAWDNNYSMKQFMLSPLRWIKHFIDRASMRKLARKADLFYVISDVQKIDYEKSFRKECKLLTKDADFSEPPLCKEQYNIPLQLIFTGNIAVNRWRSLQMMPMPSKESTRTASRRSYASTRRHP